MQTVALEHVAQLSIADEHAIHVSMRVRRGVKRLPEHVPAEFT